MAKNTGRGTRPGSTPHWSASGDPYGFSRPDPSQPDSVSWLGGFMLVGLPALVLLVVGVRALWL